MAQQAGKTKSTRRSPADFFISYTGLDVATATYFRQWLEAEGFSTFMQQRDFAPTSYIPEKMEEGLKARRLLAVMSDAYLHSPYCRSELGAAYFRDPTNTQGRMVIVRIASCDVPELLAPISRVELVGKGEHTQSLFIAGIRALPKMKAARRKVAPSSAPAPSIAPPSPPKANHAHAEGDGSIAFIGDNNKIYVGEPKESRKPAKPPKDQITEEQGVKLKLLLGEIMELDSASYGADLSEGELRQKWWGALGKVVPNTTYKNYSQAKYRRAMKWLRQQRARLIAGAAEDAPELSRHAAIRTIHVLLSKWKFSNQDKLAYYSALSSRLKIQPPFASSKDLSDADLQSVYRAMYYDDRKRGTAPGGNRKTKSPRRKS